MFFTPKKFQSKLLVRLKQESFGHVEHQRQDTHSLGSRRWASMKVPSFKAGANIFSLTLQQSYFCEITFVLSGFSPQLSLPSSFCRYTLHPPTNPWVALKMNLQLIQDHLLSWKAGWRLRRPLCQRVKQFGLHLEGECWILSAVIIDAAATTLCSISND